MKLGNLMIPSRLRLGITVVIALMIISSPVLMFINPTQVSAAPTISNNSNRIDSSGYHSTPSIPAAAASSPLPSPTPMVPATSNLGNDGDFTTQAALTGVSARQTNNIVGSQSYYDVVFVTSTTGTIRFIDITFPPGTLIGAAPRLVEREGIGAGNAIQVSNTKISYTVISPVSIPEGTKIRLEFFNLVNPTLPSTGYKVTVTTRNEGGTVIDGPTASNGFSMKQIGTGQIADGAITSNKIPPSEIGGDKIIDFSITNEDLSFGSVRVNNHADVIFASCSINWGTVVQDGGTNAQCDIPFVALGDHVVATQDDGIPGLTLTLALALENKVHLVVRNYGPTTDFGIVRYAIIIYKATT